MKFLSVFSPNAKKCGPEKNPYLNTFHAATKSAKLIPQFKISVSLIKRNKMSEKVEAVTEDVL